jgi:hypothetical protein
MTVIELDARRRANLARIARAEDERYFVSVEADGTIVLTPAVVMTSFEAKLLARPDLVKQIREEIDSGVRVEVNLDE